MKVNQIYEYVIERPNIASKGEYEQCIYYLPLKEGYKEMLAMNGSMNAFNIE